MRLALAMAVLAAAAASSAQAQLAGLRLQAGSDITVPLDHGGYAGPLSVSLSDRSQTARMSADYGSLNVSATQRTLSLADGAGTRVTEARATWFDGFTLTGAPTNPVPLSFFIDVLASSSSGRVSGFRNAGLSTTASWGLTFASFDPVNPFDPSPQFVGASGSTTRTVSPRGLVSLVSEARPFGDASFAPSLELVGALGSGWTRWRLSGSFATGRYAINSGIGCTTTLSSWRIADAGAGTCRSALKWGGLASGPGGISMIGASGYDYAQGFDVPAGRLAPMAMNQPAALAAAVPEPATWAMMIAGFGLVGVMARRRVARAA